MSNGTDNKKPPLAIPLFVYIVLLVLANIAWFGGFA